MSRLGITRLAKQTDLDRIGIPCFSAIRPNGRTLSVSQGKGISEAAAAASAVMEAAEHAIAEAPECSVACASAASLSGSGFPLYLAERQLPINEAIDPSRPITWTKGRSIFTGRSIYVPLDAVTIGGQPTAHPGLSRSTNGLASGNSMTEAVFHGLCELIERDATTIWGLRPERQAATEFAPESFNDAVIDDLISKIANAGMTLRVFNQTADFGVPVVMAIIHDPIGSGSYFDLATGIGCHPLAYRATLRAITEAAQTRVTNIAGARDDFEPEEYRRARSPDTLHLLESSRATSGRKPESCTSGFTLSELLGALLSRLRQHRAGDIFAVPLSGQNTGFAVTRVIAPMLEDRGPNVNWRPGPRAVRVLLEKT
jgi:ribosomal protein S12 methylthiotransferase accessory factor